MNTIKNIPVKMNAANDPYRRVEEGDNYVTETVIVSVKPFEVNEQFTVEKLNNLGKVHDILNGKKIQLKVFDSMDEKETVFRFQETVLDIIKENNIEDITWNDIEDKVSHGYSIDSDYTYAEGG
ncbi:MAG: hypothetical protein GY828_03145 [Candidatus Gracilibacteria bacterium]|nr:hypothetical protein [Candidatus Gracilibacteria bacterium]